MDTMSPSQVRSTLQQDGYGLLLSTTAVAAAAYVRAVDRLLSLGADPETELQAAIAADPEFALAHVTLALRRLRQGQPDAAAIHLARARAGQVTLTPHEQGPVDAMAAILDGSPMAALAVIRTHLATFPREALLLQEANAIISASGAPDLRRARWTLMASVSPSYDQDGWFMGDSAFELAEAGHCATAQRLAERALTLRPQDANAVHSLVHALSEAGDQAGAAALLDDWLPGYSPLAPEYSHLSWHLAMSALRLGRREQALAVYHTRLDPRRAPGTRLRDAAGFLWSLMLAARTSEPLSPRATAGQHNRHDMPSWEPVRDLAACTGRQPMEAADAIHAAMAFAATGDQASAERRALAGGPAPAGRHRRCPGRHSGAAAGAGHPGLRRRRRRDGRHTAGALDPTACPPWTEQRPDSGDHGNAEGHPATAGTLADVTVPARTSPPNERPAPSAQRPAPSAQRPDCAFAAASQ